MNWKVPVPLTPTIDVGVTTTDDSTTQCKDFVLSRTKAVLDMDQIQGNIGTEGAWVYKLGEMTASAEQACLNWYYKNDGLNDQRKKVFGLLPKCPCVQSYTNRMEAFGIWAFDTYRNGLQDGKRMSCYHLTRAASQSFYPFGKECCYKYDRSEPSNEIYLLVQDKPDAATLTAYNPFFPETYRHYVQEDKMAYDDCCLKSNSLLCDKFYELRPVGDCESDPPFVFAWLCCDIVTLDERGYTFNGWGEYTMVTASSPVAFTLQARTDLVETESGKLSNATVFTAFGAEENPTRVFFGLDPNTKNCNNTYYPS
ncbi:hypothetical protein V1264_008492 [Littorina saxatilis]|uniref:AMOP domain-containing protein n=1 Tax=Littorina saxatilis TaxID=31220 RepID=A0AAN9ATH6_9CAEN